MTFEIQVSKLPARVVTCDGGSLAVSFFLHPSLARAARPESLFDRLNDDRGEFLPCSLEGEVCLLSRNWVLYVEVSESDAGALQARVPGVSRHDVELDLSNGETLRGELVYGARSAGQARVSDYLNLEPDPFLLLEIGERVLYVNRQALTMVRC